MAGEVLGPRGVNPIYHRQFVQSWLVLGERNHWLDPTRSRLESWQCQGCGCVDLELVATRLPVDLAVIIRLSQSSFRVSACTMWIPLPSVFCRWLHEGERHAWMAGITRAEDARIAVLGLGYVGLPLAVHFAARYPVVGFDIDQRRIDELRAGLDRTLEVTPEEFSRAKTISYSCKLSDIADQNFYIVTVATPIDQAKQPDLSAIKSASRSVGQVLSSGDYVVFESTVYPGVTEDVCVPILEGESGLKLNEDFFVGYSPERINPGDLEHRLPSILKITSGSTPEAADLIDQVYGSIIEAGTHKAGSIKVAEAAKVIENIQRDVNIALINELELLFQQLEIPTRDVLAAAGTKWNFHKYTPGLVGGHCIGVDPYYLTYKAQSIGFHPEMILAGRRINDRMPQHYANEVVRQIVMSKRAVHDARVLVMGFTFKENCPDIRNTKVIDLVTELQALTGEVVVYDPLAAEDEVQREYGINVVNELPGEQFDAVVLAVSHKEVRELIANDGLDSLLKPGGAVCDIKFLLQPEPTAV